MFKKILSKKNKYYGFTLVELIIVITILSILATISFVSFSGYTANSRDSNRLFSLKEISKSLTMQKEITGNFPQPDEVYAKGGIPNLDNELFSVGLIGKNVSNYVKLGGIPLDPKTGSEYLYGLTRDNKNFQVAGTLENLQSSIIIEKAYADAGIQAVVEGDYKGVIRFSTGSSNYIGNIPSLIFSRTGTYSIEKRFVINKGKNLPYSLDGKNLGTGLTPELVLKELHNKDNLALTGVVITNPKSETEIKQISDRLGVSDVIVADSLGNKEYASSGGSSGGGGSGISGGKDLYPNKCQLIDGIENFGTAYSKGIYNPTLDLCECGPGELYVFLINENFYNYGYNNGTYIYFNKEIRKIENSTYLKIYNENSMNIINGSEFENKSTPGFCTSQVTGLASFFEIDKNIVGTNCSQNPTSKEFFSFDKNTGLIYGYDFLNGPMDVVVPCEIDGVKVIGINELGLAAFSYSTGYGFGQNKFLTSLFLPDTIQYLGYKSLAYNQIPTVNLPKSVKYIYYGLVENSFEAGSNKTSQVTCGGGYNSIKFIHKKAFNNNGTIITKQSECITPIGSDPFFSGGL